MPGFSSARPGDPPASSMVTHCYWTKPPHRTPSIGSMYGNTPGLALPPVYFKEGREAGAIVGFATFMAACSFATPAQPGAEQTRLRGDAAIRLDQDERVVSVAQCRTASDGHGGLRFPRSAQPFQPLAETSAAAGPERTMVKANPGESAYEAWANGIRRGAVGSATDRYWSSR